MRQRELNWKVTVFSLLCLALFLRLGVWQLDRASEKEALLERQAVARNLPPVALSTLADHPENAGGALVSLQGSWRPEVFLLDNRVLAGTVGFEVLAPFDADDLALPVLVNRGFVAMGRTRDDVPAIPRTVDGEQTITGHIYLPTQPDEVASAAGAGAVIIQAESPAAVGKVLNERLYPYVVRLSEENANALPRYWPTTVMSEAQHIGYAVQWFAMAFAVVLLFLYFTFGQKRHVDRDP